MAVIPEQLKSFCAMCPHSTETLPEMVEHLERDHGLTATRWPDGGLVIDASDTPELMERT